MKYSRKILTILLTLFLTNTACASDKLARFDQWKNHLKKIAKDKGHEKELVEEVFSVIEYSEKYKIHDNKQFEPKTFNQYYENAVNGRRIRKAKSKIKENKEILTKIESQFGVPKEFIVSLWAIETDMGSVKGHFNVINSLANLSFDERRRALFLNEFLSAIEVYKQGHFDNIEDFKGSWAGAIGQCQFLPSTYLKHGFDFNKDGKINIWGEKGDVLASIANYLQSLGWNNEVNWGYELKNIKSLDSESIEKITEKQILKDLIKKYDLKPKNGKKFTLKDLSQKAQLVRQEDRLFITFKNYDLIKEWNRSTHFALTVGLLADEIILKTAIESYDQ